MINKVKNTRKKSDTMYHYPDSCNNCGGSNEVTPTDYVDYAMCEAKTKCKDCGFEDYWAYGLFDSGADGLSNCKKYGIPEGKVAQED
jgi:hypothetical protein